jgi:selenocysteine lyase/cysteine desulfurase
VNRPGETLNDRTRRDFLAAVGLASTLAAAPNFLSASALNLQEAKQAGKPASQSEYMLAPGLTYLNTASLGPTPRAVLDRTLQAWYELESEPVRMAYYSEKDTVLVATDHVREQAASFLGCTTDEFLITRSTTDAMNSLALGMRINRDDHVLTTDQEHDGGSICWRYLARRQGVIIDKVQIAPTDQDPKAIVRRFAEAITTKTRVISVSHVLSSTGLRMPVAEIATLAKAHGILCVVDGAQALGQIDVNVRSLGCDAYAASGHKWLMGPKGTGLLYISHGAHDFIEPIQREDGNRCVQGSTGVSSLPLVVGLGAAIERMKIQGMAAVENHNVSLRNRAYAGLTEIPKLRLMSAPPGPLATALVACMLPAEIDSNALRIKLYDKYKIVVKMVEKHSFNGIRLSPHIFNTEADIDLTVEALRRELA